MKIEGAAIDREGSWMGLKKENDEEKKRMRNWRGKDEREEGTLTIKEEESNRTGLTKEEVEIRKV